MAFDNIDINKKKSLEMALGQIEKQFGKGSINILGDEGKILNIEGISTTSLRGSRCRGCTKR